VFTGGDKGIGEHVLKGVNDNDGLSVVFFPGTEKTLPEELVVVPICTGLGYGVRDIVMLRAVEAVISISGGAGTLNELANAYHLYKPILTLKKSGGWTEKLENEYIDSRKKVKILAYETVDDLVFACIKEIEKQRKFNRLIRKVRFVNT